MKNKLLESFKFRFKVAKEQKVEGKEVSVLVPRWYCASWLTGNACWDTHMEQSHD